MVYRVVRRLSATKGWPAPQEPTRKFRFIDDAQEMADELKKVLTWIESCAGQPLSPRDGPGDELGVLWWQSQGYDLEIEPSAWKLLKVLWGKPSMDVTAVLKALKKPQGSTYNSLKTTLYRLNNAITRAHLPRQISFAWSKKRSENLITCKPPPVRPSVSDKFQG